MRLICKCWGSLLVALGLMCFSMDAVAWRSTLYPENWTPGLTTPEGRFLHDFSCAGYHNGAAALPTDHFGPVFDVAQCFGAVATACLPVHIADRYLRGELADTGLLTPLDIVKPEELAKITDGGVLSANLQ